MRSALEAGAIQGIKPACQALRQVQGRLLHRTSCSCATAETAGIGTAQQHHPRHQHGLAPGPALSQRASVLAWPGVIPRDDSFGLSLRGVVGLFDTGPIVYSWLQLVGQLSGAGTDGIAQVTGAQHRPGTTQHGGTLQPSFSFPVCGLG